jgi:hypothetical protein
MIDGKSGKLDLEEFLSQKNSMSDLFFFVKNLFEDYKFLSKMESFNNHAAQTYPTHDKIDFSRLILNQEDFLSLTTMSAQDSKNEELPDTISISSLFF